MADGTNQNDQVKDLLARLRSQMSQLDEMFGTAPSDADTAEAPATEAPEPEAPEAEAFAPTDASVAADGLSEEGVAIADAPDLPDGEENLGEADSGVVAPTEELPQELVVAPASDPVSLEDQGTASPTQMDFLAALSSAQEDDILLVPSSEESVEDTDSAPFDDADEDDTPIFVREDAPLRIRKESIVAQETLVDGDTSPAPKATVTEIAFPTPRPEEKAEGKMSFFVPSTTDDEERVSASSPFSTERRFDPSRYDKMLADYEKRRNGTVAEPKEEPSDVASTPSSVIPASPILMSERILPFSDTLALADTPAEENASAQKTPSEDIPTADAPTEDAPAEIPMENAPSADIPAADAPTEDAPAEIPMENAPSADIPTADAPTADAPAENGRSADTSEEKADQAPAPPRVVRAELDLSETELTPRTRTPMGRVHLAPTAYRAKESRERERNLSSEDEEDFLGGLPAGIRASLEGAPLGRPNRAQTSVSAPTSKGERKGKRRRDYAFPEEIYDGYEADDATDYMRHRLDVEIHQTRVRLIVIAVLAFILLLFENITHISPVPSEFVETQTAGIIDALLLFGITFAAWPRLYVGLKGLLHGRVIPESVLLVEVAAALSYAAASGILGTPVAYFSFVPALGLALLYCFRVVHTESRLRIFEKINVKGEKLLLSPASKRHADGKTAAQSGKEEERLLYRVKKTSSVDGFSRRSAAVCEDEGLNFGLLLLSIGVGVACFLIALLFHTQEAVTAATAALFGGFLAAPLVMCGVHVYSVYRADKAAGEDSAVVGEATVREAVRTSAIAFEDVEAAPSAGVVLSGIQVHCDDPTTVFKYLTALYGHIGGPLCGRFSGMYVNQSASSSAMVELVDATKDGISAAIDGAEIVVGNGDYMQKNGISLALDTIDPRALPEAKEGVLYVAVNGMICMKFYMEHRISVAFEKNVTHLYRLGIATVLRTYDPNFNEKMLFRVPALKEAGVDVLSKRVDQVNDFYAQHADGGLVTTAGTSKLLRLLLLCFRTSGVLRFGRFYKLAACLLGGAAAVLLAVMGAHTFIPSVYVALYHLVCLGGFLLFSRIRITLPHISNKK